MVIDGSGGPCPKCRDAVDPSSNSLKEIGEAVFTKIILGRGTDTTNYSFFQCKKCGSVWTHYVDSGAGGHGRFWKKLTNF